MASKEQVTKGLLEVGACWANSSSKYQGTGFNDVRPTWHIHPDSTYPHEACIKQFDTLQEVWGWIQTAKQIDREQLNNEQAYDLWQLFYASIEK